jgi:hypothetical protein
MGSRLLLLAGATILLSAGPMSVSAQDAAGGTRIWGSLVLGEAWNAGTEKTPGSYGPGVTVELALARGAHVLAARAGEFAFVDDLREAGLLYARRSAFGGMQVWAGLGLGYVELEESVVTWKDGGWATVTNKYSAVGIPFVAELSLFPTVPIGLGVRGFGNVNSVTSYAGIGLVLRIGRVR